jgi:CubicO group peptidase (beta-lactamase class C family)
MQVSRSCFIRALAISAVLFAFGASGATAEDRAARIDAYLSRCHEVHQFDGAVLAADEKGVFFKRGYGLADREWDAPNIPDAKYRIGSVTKQFTATLVMQLVEEGKLSLDAKLSDLLPYYRKDTGEKVTLRQLLNHTSGIPSFTENPAYEEIRGGNRYGVQEVVKRYCSGDLQFEPGSQFRYNNSGYYLLGAILEQVTGRPYGQLLTERISVPLKMTHTSCDRSRDVTAKRASGYRRFPGGVRNCPYVDMSVPFAAGAMISTVEDLYLWDRALYTDKVLSEQSKRAMFTPGHGDYGFGWSIRKQTVGPQKAERTVISHSGGIEGFTAHIRRIPDEKLVVILLDNCEDGSLNAIASGIVDIVYGRDPAHPKRSAAEAFYRVHRKDGAPAAVANLKEMTAQKDGEYDLSEPAINQLGYQLLGEKEPEAAVAVFRMNVEMYPDSSNVYDSLGEGLAALDKKDEAIKAYAKSLELDPKNRNAVEWLDKLTK